MKQSLLSPIFLFILSAFSTLYSTPSFAGDFATMMNPESSLEFNFTPEKKENPVVTYCHQIGGKVLNQWTCPNSKRVRTGPYCEITNTSGQQLHFNGCTGAQGSEYGEIFLKACILHDFCYHHESSSNGQQKEDCDDKLLDDMFRTCEMKKDTNSCYITARLFYWAVKVGGNRSWSCSNTKADYPKNLEDLP